MNRLAAIFLILAAGTAFSMLSSSSAMAKEKITWLIWELSPEYIRHGDYAGQGFVDKYLQYYISQLPEYDHKIVWTGIKRFHVESLKSGRCTPHIWKAFHLDKFKYSRAYMLTPPHIAIFHKRFEKELGPPGTLHSITDLLGERKYRLITPILSMDQPRYPVLHPYLKPFANTPQIVELKDGSNEADLRLLERGRADFALGYVTAIKAQQRDRDLKGDFVSYGLVEHQQYKDIHVSCFGDNLGQEIIGKINKILDKGTLKRFLKIYEEWNNNDVRFRQAFEEKILNRQVKEN
jgi:hypothetical protein